MRGCPYISIHPPRAGRDLRINEWKNQSLYFNPPSPCGEGQYWTLITKRTLEFQSTLPVRGGTPRCLFLSISCRNFNPPSPCGEGRFSCCSPFVMAYFNPPSPCGEGRHHGNVSGEVEDFNPPSPCGEGRIRLARSISALIFQSALPVRGGTGDGEGIPRVETISIHPPRAGRDPTSTLQCGHLR